MPPAVGQQYPHVPGLLQYGGQSQTEHMCGCVEGGGEKGKGVNECAHEYVKVMGYYGY